MMMTMNTTTNTYTRNTSLSTEIQYTCLRRRQRGQGEMDASMFLQRLLLLLLIMELLASRGREEERQQSAMPVVFAFSTAPQPLYSSRDRRSCHGTNRGARRTKPMLQRESQSSRTPTNNPTCSAIITPSPIMFVRWKQSTRSTTVGAGKTVGSEITSFQNYTIVPTPTTPLEWDFQTAVVTYQRKYNGTMQQLDLHAQLHIAQYDYFAYYNSPTFLASSSGKMQNTPTPDNRSTVPVPTIVLYELLTDETLLEPAGGSESFASHLSSDCDTDRRRNGLYRMAPAATTVTTPSSSSFTSPITASLYDQRAALRYGWHCQANVINYTQPYWFHADWTRQELLRKFTYRRQQQQQQQQQQPTRYHRQPSLSTAGSSYASNPTNSVEDWRQPLWKVVQRRTVSQPSNLVALLTANPAVQMASQAILTGPPWLSAMEQWPSSSFSSTQWRRRKGPTSGNTVTATTTSTTTRRLFTNLFLPGSTLAWIIRSILWLAVPAPELSILILDWSSLYRQSALSSFPFPSSPTGHDSADVDARPSTMAISPLTLPLLEALSMGQFQRARQILFGQMVLAGHATYVNRATNECNRDGWFGNDNHTNPDPIPVEDDEDDILIRQRNQHALHVLSTSWGRFNSMVESPDVSPKVALLYGCNHCPDLHVRLMQQGFEPFQVRWRTAFSVPSHQSTAMTSMPGPSSTSVPILTPSSFLTSFRDDTSFVTPAILLIVVSYLSIMGWDWIDSWRSLILTESITDRWIVVTAYLIRHIFLYIGVTRIVWLDWQSSSEK